MTLKFAARRDKGILEQLQLLYDQYRSTHFSVPKAFVLSPQDWLDLRAETYKETLYGGCTTRVF